MTVDRIDFKTLPNGQVLVQKFSHEDAGFDRLTSTAYKGKPFNVEAAICWCQENGYKVRRWTGWHGPCARAFRGQLWPIRSRRQMARLRRQVEKEVASWIKANPGKPTLGLTFLDFAYDF